MLTKTIAATMTVSTVLGLAGTAHAQPQLDIVGESIPFTGTFEEYRVPNLRGSVVRFVAYGGDGGDAVAGPNANCFNSGGQGATVDLTTIVGFDDFQLRPGQPIRFIVGGEGEEGRRRDTFSAAGGGGGGGSGVAYQDPDLMERNGWRPLVVAGGGGGASSSRSGGRCTEDEQDGGAAEIGTAGANGESVVDGSVVLGGQDGGPGGTNASTGGGGGVFSGSPFRKGGGAGFGPDGDNPIGGEGGTGTEFEGAFGFGGGGGTNSIRLDGSAGGGGGGGGGYSGGGAGNTQSAGGGGGSFADEDFAFLTPAFERNSPVGPNGRIDYEFVQQIHDSRALALPLIVGETGAISEVGTTFLATISVVFGAPITNGDVWYTYTNASDVCSEVLTLNTQLGTELVAIVNNGDPQFPSAGTISLTLEPGDTVELRVSTVTNPSAFNITGSVGVVDQDGDGFCDAIDICQGVDDSTLDPADDVDLDGIHDVCDRLCAEDVVPDGVFDAADLEQIATVVASGTDQDVLQFDIDSSGEFDYFDWIEYFDGCE